MPHDAFEIVCEVEPPTRPDLMHVRHQIGVLSKVASAFLIPDNHIGRATVSSVAVAHEVEQHGRPLDRVPQRARPQPARLPPRPADRGGVRRRPVPVRVRRPADVGRAYRPAHRAVDDRGAARVPAETRSRARPFRAGVAAGAGPLPAWKRDADFLFAQVRFSLDEMLEWRAQVEFDGPVYAGVMVVPSVAMARKIGADIQQLAVPDAWLAAIERDPNAGRRRSRATSWSACGSRARSTACT